MIFIKTNQWSTQASFIITTPKFKVPFLLLFKSQHCPTPPYHDPGSCSLLSPTACFFAPLGLHGVIVAVSRETRPDSFLSCFCFFQHRLASLSSLPHSTCNLVATARWLGINWYGVTSLHIRHSVLPSANAFILLLDQRASYNPFNVVDSGRVLCVNIWTRNIYKLGILCQCIFVAASSTRHASMQPIQRG